MNCSSPRTDRTVLCSKRHESSADSKPSEISLELSQEIQAFLYATHSRFVTRLTPATCLPIPHPSYCRYRYRGKGCRLCVVGAAGRNDASFQCTAIDFIRSKILLHISTRINISLISNFFI